MPFFCIRGGPHRQALCTDLTSLSLQLLNPHLFQLGMKGPLGVLNGFLDLAPVTLQDFPVERDSEAEVHVPL